MNNLKIRQKFLILGFIAFISLIFLGWLSLKINKNSFESSKNVVTNFKQTQDIQTLYIEDLFTLREITLSLVISPNDDFKKKFDEKIMPILNRLDKNFANNSLIDRKVWENYKKQVIRTRRYSLDGFDEGAFMNTSTIERESFYLLINKLKQLQRQKLHNSEEKLANLEKDIDLNNYYIVLGVLFIGIIGFILDILILMKIVKQIENVEGGLRKFFDYLKNPTAYKGELHIDIKSNDELGLMSKAINKKVKVIKENLNDDYKLIKEATSALDHLKQGHFGNKLNKEAKSNELNVLKNVMNEMIGDLENKIKEEIIQRTNQEKLMMQQSKLAAMGEMIGNIAHQWRQPIGEINAVLMELETISKYSILEKEHLLESINTCNQITQHMSDTISDFQNFFKPSKEKENFSVLQACKKALFIINASLSNNNIKLIFDVQEDNIINGYSSEFSHAILNIISNAKDVLISRRIKNPTITISIKVGKKFTILKISDNAQGIKLEDINVIFQPYFTTKHAKKGTGIGLYMTKMIIENNMQGYVNVKNIKDGALFTIKVR
ncbi:MULTISPECIES: HAMP domain-containing sensor histidine kinase [Arcobacteraceae]|uniref:sensor histidine kinase n=1 Tax=Arcobacteraceae TaxID=2808963 RepID=UPI00100B5329|nr:MULTISPECIES: HAMP domain-containing sensor histidine kinase [Arcobacteraceae]RXJ87103.1 histidine kinase [Arcobacter sp. CECT 8985]RXJ97411.1 histidine kinase [Malaciobacter molluscorum]